ncbi:MAG: hypothetical protein WAV04_03275 [Candidatus Microsaccharimonas sp.]
MDYSWKPDGHKIKVQGVPYQWPLALRNFVLPVRHQDGWIENSKNVTNTGLSAREWFGLVVHAVAMSDVSGDEILVATEDTGGDGAVVSVENGENMAVLVEQTLATHKEDGDLLDVIRRRVRAKSSMGENYAENKHLVILCNNNGDLIEKKLAKIVSIGMFDIVNIIGFQDNEQGRHFLSYIFDKDVPNKAIHRMVIDDSKLWQAAIDIFEEEQKVK